MSGFQQQTSGSCCQTIAGNRFVLSHRIGKGGFGDVYEAQDIWTNQSCAVKLERVDSRKRYLFNEYSIYKMLNGIDGVCEALWCGTEGPFNIIVMPLLGYSLNDIMSRFKRLSVCTVLKLGLQLVSILEEVHRRGVLHRDIKPGNFLIGRGEYSDKLFLVDFGLSTLFRDRYGRHIPYHSSAHFHGTDKYASINSHMKTEASRRDDLESTAYALIYMVKGELPWQHITNKETRRKRMGQMKMQFTPEQLCAGLPHCFAEFLRYSMSLEFAAEPDYAYLRRLFEDTLNMIPGSWAAPYEWTVHSSTASRPAFIHSREELNTNWTETVPAQLESPGNSSLGHSSPPATPISNAIPPNPWQQGGFSKIQLSVTSAHCHSQEFKCVGVPSPRPVMEPIVIDDDNMDVDYTMQFPSAGILTVA